MSFAVNAVLLAMATALGLIPFLLTARLKRRLPALAARGGGAYFPPAALILPCKGIDPGFRQNIASLLEQDYPTLELLFIVAADDDPAYPALKELLAEQAREGASRRVKLLVADTATGVRKS